MNPTSVCAPRKDELILGLRSMLADVYVAKESGEAYERLARAHGYVDGYMRALIELGAFTKDELLEIVTSERERSRPAIRLRSNVVEHAA
jgi:hypothetical protein